MMRALVLALMTTAASAAPLWAEKLPLAEISAYLNDLKTAEGDFTQINDDGSISTGKVYIKRPGRMRFEYNPPDSALVIAGSGAVVIDDKKSNQPPETYPLRRTPLSIILAREVDLGRAEMVVGHEFDGTATIVTAQDPENPEYGNLQLKFTSEPIELRQWVVNDAGGGSTTVILGDMQIGGRLANALFDVGAPGQKLD